MPLTKCIAIAGEWNDGVWLVDVIYAADADVVVIMRAIAWFHWLVMGRSTERSPSWIFGFAGEALWKLDYLLFYPAEVDHVSQSAHAGFSQWSFSFYLRMSRVLKCSQRKVSRAHPGLGKWWSGTRCEDWDWEFAALMSIASLWYRPISCYFVYAVCSNRNVFAEVTSPFSLYCSEALVKSHRMSIRCH